MDLLENISQEVCEDIKQKQDDVVEDDELKSWWSHFQEFRENGLFCDVLIKSRDSNHSAHKCLLSIFSPYLKTLFITPVSHQTPLQIVNLSEFSGKTVEYMLDLMYMVDDVDVADVAELLQLAEFIQYDWLVNELVGHLRSYINITNCHVFYEVGRRSGADKLAILAKSVMIARFDEIPQVVEDTQTLEHIKEIVSIKESVFQKQVVVGFEGSAKLSERPLYVMDMSKGQMTVYKKNESPWWFGYFSWISSGSYFHFRFLGYFFYCSNLFIVVERNNDVQIRCYQQCYDGNCSAAEGIERGHTYFSCFQLNGFVNCFYYDNLHSLYFCCYEETKNKCCWHIFKFDLVKKVILKGWIELSDQLQTNCGPKFVSCKTVGTIIICAEDEFKFYSMDNFDFEKEGENHTPIHLPNCTKPALAGDPVGSSSDKWNVFDCNNKIYLLIESGETPSRLCICLLDEEHFCWIKCFNIEEVDIAVGYLKNVFVSDGEPYLAFYIDTKDYILYHLDIKRRTLSDTNIRFPSKDLLSFSVFPSYFLL